ncbi:MAG: DUF5658 family protein [Pseudomonadota bacterium]|nr:DUF5658 family protein [Pseudomonadota bacterium]
MNPTPTDRSAHERRDRNDRRRRVLWSVCYGSFMPRRRVPPRRIDESRFHTLDWHSPHLLGVAIAILLLSVLDAFLTPVLMQGGAAEVNPIMAVLLYRSIAVFAALKITMTSVSLVFMVALARYRFMRLILVEWVLYGVLIGYLSLIAYEYSMLTEPIDLPIL